MGVVTIVYREGTESEPPGYIVEGAPLGWEKVTFIGSKAGHILAHDILEHSLYTKRGMRLLHLQDKPWREAMAIGRRSVVRENVTGIYFEDTYILHSLVDRIQILYEGNVGEKINKLAKDEITLKIEEELLLDNDNGNCICIKHTDKWLSIAKELMFWFQKGRNEALSVFGKHEKQKRRDFFLSLAENLNTFVSKRNIFCKDPIYVHVDAKNLQFKIS